MASAGRILIMPKGAYDSSATYEMLDMVSHNGTTWLAKKTVSNIEPSEANSEYWHNMVDMNKVLADTLGGYKISTEYYSGETDTNGFLADINLPDTVDILSCKLMSSSGFCLPYNNVGVGWSFLIEDWGREPMVNESVYIKVIYASALN